MNPGTMTFPKTPAEVSAMQVGDHFYSEGFFVGVTDKRIKWTVVTMNVKRDSGIVRPTYFGVSLGEYEISAVKGKVRFNGLKA